MAVHEYTREEFGAEILDYWQEGSARVFAQVNGWRARGDGAAVYENHDLGHPDLGDQRIVSFGSAAAMIESDEPPERLPDIGGTINWRYVLVGTYKGAAL